MFSIYLVDCLVTFWAEMEIFCFNLVTKRPTSKNLDPQSFENEVSNCAGRFALGVEGVGILSICALIYFSCVLKQNYINRLPLSVQRSLAVESRLRQSQRESARSSLGPEEIAVMISVNMPQANYGVQF